MLNLLTSALIILSAIALLGASTVLGDPSIAVVESERDDLIVHDFYRAINEVIRTGDATTLDEIVAEDLDFHSPSTEFQPNRSGLEEYLMSVHEAFPAFQLQIKDVARNGDQAIVRVDEGSGQPGRFLEIPLTAAPTLWGQFDSLRIAGRKIVEMRSAISAPVLAELAPATRIDLGAPPQGISFEWLSADAGEHREWESLHGARILYVEEGALKVRVVPGDVPPVLYAQRNGVVQVTSVDSRTPVRLAAGDAISFSFGDRYTIWHEAKDPNAAALTVALPQVLYNGPLQPEKPTAIQSDTDAFQLEFVQAIFGAEQERDLFEGVTVAIGCALLPAGTRLSLGETEGYLLIVIEKGALVLTGDDEVISLSGRTGERFLLVELGKPIALHNLGGDSTSILLVSVRSQEAS
jgi:predicted ester cyclase